MKKIYSIILILTTTNTVFAQQVSNQIQERLSKFDNDKIDYSTKGSTFESLSLAYKSIPTPVLFSNTSADNMPLFFPGRCYQKAKPNTALNAALVIRKNPILANISQVAVIHDLSKNENYFDDKNASIIDGADIQYKDLTNRNKSLVLFDHVYIYKTGKGVNTTFCHFDR